MFKHFFENLPPKIKVLVHALDMAIPAAYMAAVALKRDLLHDVLQQKPELAILYIVLVALVRFLVELTFGQTPKSPTDAQ
ncbi:hypothetical protein DYU11_18480 [Fibrisoma montanum]|uniref:Uncharacterized protein n=1 Tax=Fibrisoma montanum TaxID=2305895 RepID=A0A418M688_9BACT|nr:hypothetical protein [Fibrisoma montanum]RIV21393.1 hypothetical protein DYU11_18480 [Fibrisoma montanum]